jgi:hypothetical protein
MKNKFIVNNKNVSFNELKSSIIDSTVENSINLDFDSYSFILSKNEMEGALFCNLYDNE